MNLPSDLQRLLPYVAVAVLAVVGLFLVMRGVGTSGGGSPGGDSGRTVQQQDPQPPGDPAGGGTGNNSGPGAGSQPGDKPAVPKRSREAYLNCVQQATDTAALERCQAFLPRR